MVRGACAAAVLAAACNFFEPRFPAGEGVFRCVQGAKTDGACPPGHVCVVDRCVPEEGAEAEGEGDVVCAAGGTPSIRIAEPGQGQCVREGMLVVSVVSTDFTFDPDGIDQEAVPGCGHWHRFLDRQYLGPTAERTWEIEVGPGCHCLRAELHNNDHMPLVPPASHEVTIRAGNCGEACGEACRSPPDAGAGDAPPQDSDGGLPVSLEAGLPGLDGGATGTAEAGVSGGEDCANGEDDDGDGRTDCNDSDCERDPGCSG